MQFKIAHYCWLGIVGVLVSAGYYLAKPRTNPTPLTDFSAPFVYGRFSTPLDNPLTNEGVALGRRLFYDVRLSGNNKLACSHCHQQKLAFTDGMKGSVGSSGNQLAFNAMSLVNLMWGPQHFFWDGRAKSLEEQALMPIVHVDEMDQDIDELIVELKAVDQYQALFGKAYGSINKHNIAKALASFQRTLISSNSKYDQYLAGTAHLTQEEELGRKLFVAHPDVKASLRGGNCIDCHSQFLTSGFKTKYDGFTNNGLDSDEQLLAGLQAVTGKPEHLGLFKAPTLRNIALTAPYMHDGRFNTLEQVLDHYNEGIKVSSTLSPLIVEANNIVDGVKEKPSLNLSEQERKAIIAFLHTLTDHQFIADKAFSDPFAQESHK
jgi:cytochrome c peroxidase